jgi:UDP-N-acetylmuramoyl-L-alanyl-D-glutamate--2,6-diaminopimelate ligase
MTVRELLRSIAALVPVEARGALDAPGLDVPCSGVAYDSRAVTKGGVFVALQGQRADGAVFAPQAVSGGAAAVVATAGVPSAPGSVWVPVTDARLALALLAAELNEHPSRAMRVVGVTGTNGKTTTGYLVRSILEAAGIKCGLMGTVAYCIGDRVIEASRTTPEAPDVQGFLRQMRDEACGACVMEVSSHALSLRRVDGMEFAAGVFTNLTRDHLDFHGSMESYFAAKRRLFEMLPRDAPAVINLDDPRGTALVEASGSPVTYAINKAADVTPGPLSFSLEGLVFDVRTPQGLVKVRSTLVGRPNVYNLLGAVGVTAAIGIPLDAIERGIARLSGVPGRFEVVSSKGDDITVIVDYAHTDDALRNLLETARPIATRRLITVFGAGGERDRTKRPLMGMVAARLSDLVVITSDNPRGEDPTQIIDEVMRGAEPEARQSNAKALTIVDRREAIHQAIAAAGPADVVLIAGKGHEKYQVIGGTTYPFDDVAVAREALATRRQTSGVG